MLNMKKKYLSGKMSIGELPDELLVEQLLLLPPGDVFRLCSVDARFARICRNPVLWIRLLQRDFPYLTPGTNPKELYREESIIQEIAKRQPRTVNGFNEAIPLVALQVGGLTSLEAANRLRRYFVGIVFSNEQIQQILSRYPRTSQGYLEATNELKQRYRLPVKYAELELRPYFFPKKPYPKPTTTDNPVLLSFPSVRPATLEQALSGVSWRINQPSEENVKSIMEIENEIPPILRTPISGLHRVVMYYPVFAPPGSGGEYYHRVEYASSAPITPLEVLTSISMFYRQPFTRDNYDALINMGYKPVVRYQEGMTIADTLRYSIFFEDLESYNDGFTIRLGS